MFRYVFITSLILSFLAFTFAGIFTKGKIKVDLEKVWSCEDENPEDIFHVSVEKCNRTNKCLNFNMTLFEPMDSKSVVQINANRWNAGGWANNAFSIKINDACKNLDKVFGKNWKTVAKKSGFTCPIQPGTYGLKHFYNDFGDVPGAIMVGKYKVKSKIIRKNRTRICIMAVINIQQCM